MFFCSQSHSDVVVRVDCSNSKNCLSHRGDLDYTIKLDANRTEVNGVNRSFLVILSVYCRISILSLLILYRQFESALFT